MPRHWYVAVVRPSKQERVERSIRILGYRLFNPRVRRKFPKRDGSHFYRIASYLPGYLFVQFDLERDHWWQVLDVKHVHRFLDNEMAPPGEPSEGRQMVRVRRGVIPAMMAEFGGQFVIDERRADEAIIRVGDTVRIKSGAYEDHRAEVLRSAHSRVFFVLDLFGKRHEVSLPREQVQLMGGER